MCYTPIVVSNILTKTRKKKLKSYSIVTISVFLPLFGKVCRVIAEDDKTKEEGKIEKMKAKRIMSFLAAVLLFVMTVDFSFQAAAEDEDLMQIAVDLGIINEDMLSRADENIKEAEVLPMLHAVFEHGYGKKSTFLDMMADLAIEGRDASRYWFASAIFYPYCEAYYSMNPFNLEQFMDQMDSWNHDIAFGQFDSDSFGVVRSNPYDPDSNREGSIGGGGIYDLCPDAESIDYGGEGMEFRHDYGAAWVAQVSLGLYDRVTGEKVLGLDENQCWNPARKMTVREAAEAAVRYWRFFGEKQKKVKVKDVGTYDPEIITRELLEKPTTLPANSCSHLPAEWHGILWDKWNWVTTGSISFNFDRIYRQADAQIVKDAGLNLVRLNLSFSWLQSPYVAAGKVNEARLKDLDRLLALCMENDIHLMIGCNQYQDFSELRDFYELFEIAGDGPKTDKEIEKFADFWQMLARRYADIPNEYLSFNLYNEICIDNEEEYERVLGPAVDAIRLESPERTIIADIHVPGLTGESMAKRGVALSYHLYDPMGFCYINELDDEKQIDPEFMHSVTWPYTENGVTYDAKKLLDTPMHYRSNSASINSLRAMAEKYGVGFQVGEFGVFGEYKNGTAPVRYSDETFFGYYRDIIETFDAEGISWILGALGGTWGLENIYPSVEGVQYEKVGYYYVDTGFRDFLKSFEKTK